MKVETISYPYKNVYLNVLAGTIMCEISFEGVLALGVDWVGQDVYSDRLYGNPREDFTQGFTRKSTIHFYAYSYSCIIGDFPTLGGSRHTG